MAIPDRVRPEWEVNSAGFREPSSELGFRMLILEAMWNMPWKKEKVAAGRIIRR